MAKDKVSRGTQRKLAGGEDPVVVAGDGTIVSPPPVERLQEVVAIPLELLDVGTNVRTTGGLADSELEDLVESIKLHGVLQPIRVRATPAGRWEVVWGQRRSIAARRAGLTHIPATVDLAGISGATLSIEQLVENLVRAELHPLDEARALRQITEADPELTLNELAGRLGRSRPWVSNTLRLLEAPEPVRVALQAGEISAAHARAMVTLDEPTATRVLETVRERALSAKATEVAVAERLRQQEWDAKRAEERRALAARAYDLVRTSQVVKTRPKATWLVRADPALVEQLRAHGHTFEEVTWDNGAMALKASESCGCDVLLVECMYLSRSSDPVVKRVCRDPAHQAELKTARANADGEKIGAKEAKREAAREERLRWAGGVQHALELAIVDLPYEALAALEVLTAVTCGPNMHRGEPVERTGEPARAELVRQVCGRIARRLAGLGPSPWNEWPHERWPHERVVQALLGAYWAGPRPFVEPDPREPEEDDEGLDEDEDGDDDLAEAS